MPLRRLALFVLVAFCLEVIFAVPYRSFYLATESVALSWVAGLGSLCCAGILYRFRGVVASRLSSFTAGWTPGRSWFVAWWVAGVLLRVSWALLLHTEPKSDGLTYFQEATNLAVHHAYEGAFFPPGLPLFEAPLLMLFGARFWVAVPYALLTFSGIFLVVSLLGKQLASRRVAAFACVLVALWPNDVASSGVNDKEELLALLITTAIFLYVRSWGRKPFVQILLLLGGGLLVGFAALTQPAFLLFPAVILFSDLFRRLRGWRDLGRSVARTFVFSVAVMAAVLPWTYRNYLVFHRVVLISNNGGSVFYRANNAKANAQYIPEGTEKLPKDEFAASAEGYRAGKLWIRQNPGAFAKLMVRKQIVFLGDDSTGVYESMKRDRHPSALLYGGLKLFCNLAWLGAFFLLLVASSWLFREGGRWRVWFGVCVLPFVYQWCMDSVFESGSHHHNPYFALLSLLLAVAVLFSDPQREDMHEMVPSP